jgi:arsenate reductase
MTTTIWHNPRCSKSRLTLALLGEHHIDASVRLYLEDAPSSAELAVLVSQLGIRPWDLLRRGENIFKELGLNKDSPDEAVIEAMAQHPILIERPVVIHHGKAAVGRPPENVLALFD